jgi:hypothetical protein
MDQLGSIHIGALRAAITLADFHNWESDVEFLELILKFKIDFV